MRLIRIVVNWVCVVTMPFWGLAVAFLYYLPIKLFIDFSTSKYVSRGEMGAGEQERMLEDLLHGKKWFWE